MAPTHGRACVGGFTAQEFEFGDFKLDQAQYRLQRGDRFLRLEKLPMELLILLVERRGGLVSREEIAERLWGKHVFLDVDHGINTAIRKVRLALRDDPEKPRFVETVVGRGYRFAAPVTSRNGDSQPQAQRLPSPAPATPSPVVPHAARPSEGRIASVRLRLLLSGVAVFALLAAGFVVIRGRAGHTAQSKITSLAVLPLQNLSGDPTQEYFADGMTEEVIGRLSMIRGLRVISRTSVMRLKDTHMSVPEIAKDAACRCHCGRLGNTRGQSRPRPCAADSRRNGRALLVGNLRSGDAGLACPRERGGAIHRSQSGGDGHWGRAREASRSPLRLVGSVRELSKRSVRSRARARLASKRASAISRTR